MVNDKNNIMRIRLRKDKANTKYIFEKYPTAKCILHSMIYQCR